MCYFPFRGKDALLNRLKEAGVEDPKKYISFYGLRNHSILNGEPITELVYVHSKLMIIDDKTVICGSANINDRSLIGKRDSEIASLIEVCYSFIIQSVFYCNKSWTIFIPCTELDSNFSI